MKTIYVVTTIKSLGPGNNCERSPGWYSNQDDAINAVTQNCGDIYEGYYPYCVIEAVREGMYGVASGAVWFKWDDGYKRIENPLPHIAGFGIG